MNAEFNWWLLIVGLVVGAGLVWLVIADWSRREEDLSADERSAESAWIAQVLHDRGEGLDPAAAEEVLALHRAYLRQVAVGTGSPDDLEMPGDEVEAAESDWATDGPDTEAAATAIDPQPTRPSVRTTNLNPRSGASTLESEPPA
jgi:hypothetical protein